MGINTIVHVEVLRKYDTQSDPDHVLSLLEEYIQFRNDNMFQVKTFEKYYLPNVDLAIARAKGFASGDELLDKIGSNLGELIELLRMD